jgi:hypothetical protein
MERSGDRPLGFGNHHKAGQTKLGKVFSGSDRDFEALI